MTKRDEDQRNQHRTQQISPKDVRGIKRDIREDQLGRRGEKRPGPDYAKSDMVPGQRGPGYETR